MALDLMKLARLEEQHAGLMEGISAQADRYRLRLGVAKEKLAQAVARAHPEARNLRLADLHTLTPGEIAEYGLDSAYLQGAQREFAIAQEIRAEADRRRAEVAGFSALITRLKKYADAGVSFT